ncbi:iron export ABC transporter permease subunit FetB [Marinobacterium zhoushanense]|uniref:Iron export ABC transporter permease subunit FetB n=1 Tax=Marinobacterium zhoushanense TaxID=1679163 RepID=A0ABQ1KJQ4_9GAMM|nr:iron export ABC transporter permease subunit FetB [Marinobacterium zhoushanense]GGC02355.1 iron export ABC transporter permease subunit FetB [Marinobacterium zhoushanense]
MSVIEIGWGQLLLSLLFILLAAAASLYYQLRMERDLLVGTVRTFLQLALVGYVLQFIFDLEHPLLILLLYLWMLFWAAQAIHSRVDESEVAIMGPTFVSMAVTFTLITSMVTSLVIQVEPWYRPQYFIPLGGMIAGNAMTAISLSLERLLSSLRQQRAEVELILSLGGSWQEASQRLRRDSIKAGMIPSVNAMMTVGLVSLPGMMSGQILAGVDPEQAIRYQILVMLMLVGATALGTLIVVNLILRRCFTRFDQLRL